MIVPRMQRAALLLDLGEHARSSSGPRTRPRKPGRILAALVVVARGNAVNYITRRSFVAVAQASERSLDIALGALRYERAITTLDDFLSSACTMELGELGQLGPQLQPSTSSGTVGAARRCPSGRPDPRAA
jgi:hypothetical protein